MNLDDLYMDWEPDTVEITSKSVEKILEPIVYQVSLLVSYKGPSSRKKGQSKQADSIFKSIQDMVDEFLSRGEEIMLEAHERQRDFRAVLQDLEQSGKDICRMAEAFLADSCNLIKRKAMINAMKAMLSSVTRLMILADIADIYVLLRAVNQVSTNMDAVKNSPDLQKLTNNWKNFASSVGELINLVGVRQGYLIEDRKKNQMAAARGILKTQIPLFLTASKTYIRHPELTSALANRDYTEKCIINALELINTATKTDSKSKPLFYEIPGEIANALDNFDKLAIIKAEKYTDTEGNNLTAKIERIVNDCGVLVASPCTRDCNKQAIVTEGKTVEKNIQNLIKCYKAGVNGASSNNDLRMSQSKMLQSTEKLRVNLNAAVADHISDTFLDTKEILKMLIDAAKSGNEDQLESIAPYFSDTIAKIVEVAKLSCSVSLNYDGVKIVRLAANHIEQIYPEMINAARVLVLRPSSEVAKENLDNFRTTFSNGMTLLSEAVDNITNIRDYLLVVDAHVADDIKMCLNAGKGGSLEDFQQNVIVLRNRVYRACATVHGEMEGFRKSEYRNRVEDCLRDLEKETLPNFDRFITTCYDTMNKNGKIDEKRLFDELGEVYDGIHEIWQAVVLGRDQSGYETDRMETIDSVDGPTAQQENLMLQSNNPKPERAVMKIIPEKHNEVIENEMAGFLEQRKRLLHETTKWDDTSNEIVLTAKNMCALIGDMTDFTRHIGPLKSTSDVIETAGNVLEYGKKLNAVLAEVIKACPGSSHKSDLERCMERVSLYCHQLNMTSRVTADIHGIGDDIKTSGLDSVTTLIDTGRNLMAAVVETVKVSYIATTKYKGTGEQIGLQWKMKAPKKKPLIQRVKSNDPDRRTARRSSNMNAMDELDQFDN